MGGGPDDVPARYAEGSPINLLPFGIPQVLVVGDSDGVMPERSRNAYAAAARRAGDRATTVIVPDAGHFEVIAPIHPAWLAVRSALLSAAGQVPRRLEPDPPIVCSPCDAWNAPNTPFRIFGNTFYVGVAGLSAVLIASADGHILLDGGLPQSAPPIDANIRRLGLQTSDVRLIVNSHAHYDHAGGIAAIARYTHATVAASRAGARALALGGPVPDDPQYALRQGFPAVPSVHVIEDGETLRVGDLAVTARLTPGHTPGSTTWTWQSCQGSRCLDVVYADSLNAVSADGFRFTAQPGLVEAFRRSIATVENLPCDILLAVHPDFGGLAAKRQQQDAGNADAFVDPSACRMYAASAHSGLERRLASER
jgi:metallo-beta-lactamase class B